MEVITASKLASLSAEQSRKFQGLLPELVKRLIIDSVSDLSSIRIPGSDDIWAPGFDGVVECKEGSLYVSSGKSVWEFGNVDYSLKKVNDDYEKRTNNSLGIEKKTTTYYAVIPKIWAFDSKGCSITQWESDKNDWEKAKVYDASVLCDWINQSPVVAAWLFENIYEDEHLEFTTVSKAWNIFSRTTSPAFSTNMFINGRENEKQDYLDLLSKNKIIKVKSKTSMDSYGFCLASLMTSDDLINSVIVVSNLQTYKKVSEICKGKIILLKPMGIENFIDENISIMCYNNEAVSIEPDVCLVPLNKRDFLSALKEMGINECELEDYYYHTHGELFALVRKIPGLSNMIKPKWSDHKDIKKLFPILFLRNVDINNQADRRLCELLCEADFETLLSKYDDYLKLDDSPIKKIETIYSIVSYEEIWNVLSPDVNGNEIKRLTDTLLHILDICSDKKTDDLQIKYRAKKYIYNLSLNYLYYSYTYFDNFMLSNYLSIILERVCDTDELLSVLRLYAEAEPEMVMNMLEKDYRSDNSFIKNIFNDVGFGSSYTYILSAIDVLVSTKQAKIRACELLFEMCKIKANYYWACTPKESLLNALWLIDDEGILTLNEKKKLALKYLKDDDIGIDLCYELLIKNSSIKSVRIGSKKKNSQSIMHSEYIDTVNDIAIAIALTKRIIEKQATEYVIKIINKFKCVSLEVMKSFLNEVTEIDFELIDKVKISYAVRNKVYLNRKYTNMERFEYVKLFEEFIAEIDKKKWDEDELYLFYNNYYDCPILDSHYFNDDHQRYHEEEEYIYKCRIDALNKLLTKNNTDKYNTLLQIISDEINWGYLIAESDLKTEYEDVIRKSVENRKYYLLSGFLDRINPQIAYNQILTFPLDVQKVVLSNINNGKVALLLEDNDLRAIYWSNKRMIHYSNDDFEQLMKYNPSGLLSYYTIIDRNNMFVNKDTILEILSAIIQLKSGAKNDYPKDRDLIIRFFIEMENNSYYSDDIAITCLKLTKYNYNNRIFECIKKYYYYHPEKICKIINEKSDEFFDYIKFKSYYELPECAFDDYNTLNTFVQSIIDNVDMKYKTNSYELIGVLLARALTEDKNNMKHNVFRIVENYHNDSFDSGFMNGYDSLNYVRTVGDGTDQKEIYDRLNAAADDIELDYMHSALLLRKIAKRYLYNSKVDHISSELGLEVL